MRYFFEISYQGTHYSGWQSQPNARGIQAVVEDALSKILRSRIEIVASGRTDAGVHCEQQFFHADIPVAIEAEQLRFNRSFQCYPRHTHGMMPWNVRMSTG
jgi:tRNA pseudouridine38-40 synthase